MRANVRRGLLYPEDSLAGAELVGGLHLCWPAGLQAKLACGGHGQCCGVGSHGMQAAREQGHDVCVGRFPFNGNGEAIALGRGFAG